MQVLEALRARRAVRDYVDDPIDTETVRRLLDAAVQAPSAVDMQPWAFAIVQDRTLLDHLSAKAKKLMADAGDLADFPDEFRKMVEAPSFSIFYNAGTLIAIYAKPIGEHPDWDCCLAGENLMIAARDMGLGSCVIGFAWDVLNDPQVKEDLNVPADCKIVLPIIVGYAKEFPKSPGRKPPDIVCWKSPVHS